MSDNPPAFWLPLLWRALGAFALASPAVTLGLWERSLDEGTRFTPRLGNIQLALGPLPLLSLLFAGVFVFRRFSSHTRSFSLTDRISWVAVVLLAQLIFAVLAMAAGLRAERNWLFGHPTPDVTLPSPDGRRTADAASYGLFALSTEVFIQEGRQLTMRRAFDVPGRKRFRLVWEPDSSAVRAIHE